MRRGFDCCGGHQPSDREPDSQSAEEDNDYRGGNSPESPGLTGDQSPDKEAGKNNTA